MRGRYQPDDRDSKFTSVKLNINPTAPETSSPLEIALTILGLHGGQSQESLEEQHFAT